MSFFSSCLVASSLLAAHAAAFTGSEYRLSHEYSGLNFFEGWDFYSGRDPTGGFVTFYSRSSAQLTNLISTSEDGPAYMRVNSVDKLPFNNATGQGDGAGRPSVRIASKQAFTHGLFIGDFSHIPAGICGTWPAFWTLGPNWPYTGEVDILEGVNQNTNNIMSLHTNETCTIDGGPDVMTGTLGNTNCAYYPDYNVGCGVSDRRSTSFGVGFNQGGGGVYAMQWTSESILIWQWSRDQVPEDVDSKKPDPGSWGLPVAQLAVGNCSVDQHFQSHKIIFDTTFCGEYAGNPFVWKTKDTNSCADSTGLATCDNFVANNPEAFQDAYWEVNYVRVYQLVDPDDTATPTSYIASQQPATAATNTGTALAAVATPNLSADSLCPQYNFSVITDGKYQYEIACDFDPPGPDITEQPYKGFTAKSLADCIAGCTYMNQNNGTNKCGGVAYNADNPFCYFKKYIDGTPKYRKGFNEVRLIYYGYPQITDDPRSTADSTATSIFVETIPTPQTYRPLTTTSKATVTSTTVTPSTSSLDTATLPPGLGEDSTSTTSSLPPDYSETVTESSDATSTTSSAPSSVGSTDPQTTNSDFVIAFNVNTAARRIEKRDVQYLAFDDNNQSILVSSEPEATRFHTADDGTLMAGDMYVGIVTGADPPRFMLSDEPGAEPLTVNVDDSGNVSFAGAGGYCLTGDGALAVVPDGESAPDDCQSVEPELVSASSDSTSTTSSVDTTNTIDISSSMSTTGVSLTSMEGPPASTTSRASSTGSSASSTSRSSTTDGGPVTVTMSSVSTSRSGASSTTSTFTSASPTASLINDFIYAGCLGIPASANPASLPGISLPLTSDSMTNEKCTATCKDLGNAYYAATHDQNCFCSTSRDLYDTLLLYPDASCNTPCPGANREMCGGTVMFEGGSLPTDAAPGRMSKRQQANLILVSLYNNTLLLGQPGEDDGPGTTSSSSGTSRTSATTTATESGTVTPSPTGPLTFDPDDVIYNITGTNTATVISTTYVDICPVCPGGLTTRATTITVPHCGCTASYDAEQQTTVSVPSPVVPMVTTTKACACGEAGAHSTITVTVPHTSSISQLAAQITQIAIASASASASASAVATISAAAGGAPGAAQQANVATVVPGAGSVSPVVQSGAQVAPAAQNGVAPAPASPADARPNVVDAVANGPAAPLATATPEAGYQSDMPADAALLASATGLNGAVAAPASPPAIAQGNATGLGPSGMGVNGIVQAPKGPVQSFTSDASRLSLNMELPIRVQGRLGSSLVVVVCIASVLGLW